MPRPERSSNCASGSPPATPSAPTSQPAPAPSSPQSGTGGNASPASGNSNINVVVPVRTRLTTAPAQGQINRGSRAVTGSELPDDRSSFRVIIDPAKRGKCVLGCHGNLDDYTAAWDNFCDVSREVGNASHGIADAFLGIVRGTTLFFRGPIILNIWVFNKITGAEIPDLTSLTHVNVGDINKWTGWDVCTDRNITYHIGYWGYNVMFIIATLGAGTTGKGVSGITSEIETVAHSLPREAGKCAEATKQGISRRSRI